MLKEGKCYVKDLDWKCLKERPKTVSPSYFLVSISIELGSQKALLSLLLVLKRCVINLLCKNTSVPFSFFHLVDSQPNRRESRGGHVQPGLSSLPYPTIG